MKKMELQYDKFKIKEMAEQESDKILIALGLMPDDYGNCKCGCPVHGGDNPRGFSYKKDINTWRCFTHKCQEKTGNDIIGLVAGIKNISFVESLEWIIDLLEINPEQITDTDIERKKFLNKKKARERQISFMTEELPENDQFDELIQRGFTFETLKSVGCVFCNTLPKLYGRYCFPIRDAANNLLGYTGRKSNLLSPLAPKWKFYPPEIPTDHFFYGENFFTASPKIILVEGPLDVLFLRQNGIHNVLSPFTCDISRFQIRRLTEFNCREIVIAFDPDEGGIDGSRQVENKLSLYFKTHNISRRLPGDPSDCSLEQIQEFFK